MSQAEPISDTKRFCLLTSRLPTSLDIAGKTFQIDSRATVAIDCLIALQDGIMPEELKPVYVCKRMIAANNSNFPVDLISEGFEACKTFLDGPEEVAGSPPAPYRKKPVMDYLQDSEAIVASFWQAYNLNAEQTASLHWWVFLALLKNLPSETMFSKIVGLRTKILPSKASAEAKAELRKAQAKVTVKDRRTREQKERAAQDAINSMQL